MFVSVTDIATRLGAGGADHETRSGGGHDSRQARPTLPGRMVQRAMSFARRRPEAAGPKGFWHGILSVGRNRRRREPTGQTGCGDP